MFKNKAPDGAQNLCGMRIARLRSKVHKLSQRALADQLQDMEIDLNKNAIQKLESGARFVTDIELAALAKYFNVSADELLGLPQKQNTEPRHD